MSAFRIGDRYVANQEEPPAGRTAGEGKDDRKGLARKASAELVGTFALVLTGIGTAVMAGKHVGTLGVAIAFGAGMALAAFALNRVSGAHLNPAVTVGVAIARGMDAKGFAAYIASQIIGAVLAIGVVLTIAQGAPGGYELGPHKLGVNGYGGGSPDGYGLLAAAVAEVAAAFFFVLTVLGSTSRKAPAQVSAAAMGIALVAAHLVIMPVTNCSVNPARSIAPALFVGGQPLEQLWLFIVMPIIGGAIAALFYKLAMAREEDATA